MQSSQNSKYLRHVFIFGYQNFINMIFLPRFFYDDAAAENTGGGGEATAVAGEEGTGGENANTGAENTDAPVVIEQKVDKIELTLEEAKGYGFDSKEDMIAHFNKIKEQNKSEEEKNKAKILDDIEFRKFSVQNDLLKEDDFTSHQSLSAKADRDLVFDKYLTEFKEDNPELAADPELLEKANAEFNREYKLDSTSDKVKERGLSKLAKEAKEMRSPVESKFDSAKNQYELAKSVHTEYPKFEELVANKVKQHTPDKAVVFSVKDGDQDVNIEIDITEEDRKAMAKDFSTHKNFYKYKESGKDFEANLDKKMQDWVEVHKKAEVRKQIFEKAVEIGQKKGSNIGAENPFPLVDKNGNQSASSDKTLDEQIRESHNRAANIK